MIKGLASTQDGFESTICDHIQISSLWLKRKSIILMKKLRLDLSGGLELCASVWGIKWDSFGLNHHMGEQSLGITHK